MSRIDLSHYFSKDEFGNYIGEPRTLDENHEQSIVDGQNVTNTLNSLNDIKIYYYV